MSLKSFVLQKLLKSKLKGIPEDQQDKILAAIEKKPELFQAIATEVQEKMKGGKDQMAASMEVMQKYQNELRDIM